VTAQVIRATPVTVDLPPFTVTVPAVSAADWIIALSSDHLTWSVVPGLMEHDDQVRVIDAMMGGSLPPEALDAAAYAAIAEASGRVWWEAARLVGSAVSESGLLVGQMTLAGIDPERIPFARWCAAAYALLVDNRDEKSRMKLDANLSVPPPGFEESVTVSADEMQRLARSMPGMRTG
jgi:hypothetical protein